MDRRKFFGAAMASSAAAAMVTAKDAHAQDAVARAARGMPSPKIKDVSVIECAPQGVRLTVVKVTTDQPGLYGYGCATYTQRADLVKPAVEKYVRPLLIGKPADRIEDTWQLLYNSSYWRNAADLNNAMSGVDQALWDIKGRQAGLPVYQLLGGKAREAIDTYGHASGSEISECIDSAKKYIAQGFRHVRIQVGVPGMAGYGSRAGGTRIPALHNAPVFEREGAKRRALQLFEAARKELGPEIELLHDAHERYTPSEAVQLAKDLEQYRLFFLEDPLSPEDIMWFPNIRAQTSTPLAMGELFNSPHEWTPLIKDRLIDYMRMHMSQTGGLTPARKVAAFGEIFNVRTAFHGPGDVSPIGHMAMTHLNLSITNFGIQEWMHHAEVTDEVFRRTYSYKDGALHPGEGPGLGVEIDEKLAARYPYSRAYLPVNRLEDGSLTNW